MEFSKAADLNLSTPLPLYEKKKISASRVFPAKVATHWNLGILICSGLESLWRFRNLEFFAYPLGIAVVL